MSHYIFKQPNAMTPRDVNWLVGFDIGGPRPRPRPSLAYIPGPEHNLKGPDWTPIDSHPNLTTNKILKLVLYMTC